MSFIVDWLQKELEKISVDEIKPPEVKVKDGDKVVGILEDIEVRKILKLRNRIANDIQQQLKEDREKVATGTEEEHSSEHDTTTCEGCILKRRLSVLNNKAEFLDGLFWACVQGELSEEDLIESDKMGSSGVGIRENWQIVLTENNTPSQEIIFASSLFGLPLSLFSV